MARPDEPWEVFEDTLPFAGALYGPGRARMAAFGLGGGDLLIVSPGGSMTDARWEQLAAWGTPRFLLAPNSFHNMGIAAWKKRFPEAAAVAHPKALPRLRKKVPGVEFEGLDRLEAALPETMKLLSPPMAKQGETWISAKTSEGTAWFVTDSILNEERLPPGIVGFAARIVGFRTELMTNPLFKRIFLTDKAAYKAWVYEQLDRDKPSLFVPAHGKVLRGDDVGERLRAVTEAA